MNNEEYKKSWESTGLIEIQMSVNEISYQIGLPEQFRSSAAGLYDEAYDIREITWQILCAVYIGPYKTKKLSEKRKQKKIN